MCVCHLAIVPDAVEAQHLGVPLQELDVAAPVLLLDDDGRAAHTDVNIYCVCACARVCRHACIRIYLILIRRPRSSPLSIDLYLSPTLSLSLSNYLARSIALSLSLCMSLKHVCICMYVYIYISIYIDKYIYMYMYAYMCI